MQPQRNSMLQGSKIRLLLLVSLFLSVGTYAEELDINSTGEQRSVLNSQVVNAVKEDTYSLHFTGIWGDIDAYTLQGDVTKSINQDFGATLGINNLFLVGDEDETNVQNARAGVFFRDVNRGRVELAYQYILADAFDKSFYGLTAEYYFTNWTLGAFYLTDDVSDIFELEDANIYSNIYINDTLRLEIDLLDASDNSIIKASLQFQLEETAGHEWFFTLSYGETFWDDENEIGLSIKYVPNYSSSLKQYYRQYSTNIKSAFFM